MPYESEASELAEDPHGAGLPAPYRNVSSRNAGLVQLGLDNLLVAGSAKEGKEALLMARVQVPRKSRTTHIPVQKILLYEFKMYSTWQMAAEGTNAYMPSC